LEHLLGNFADKKHKKEEGEEEDKDNKEERGLVNKQITVDREQLIKMDL